jgi:quinolinate synthase
MKMITLDKVLTSLQNEVYEVNVPEEVAVRAKKAIDRMLEISAN